MSESLSESTVAVCPRCGGPAVDGYVMAPRGLWWDKKKHSMIARGGGSEQIISSFALTMPNAPAQRCYKCNTVTIQV